MAKKAKRKFGGAQPGAGRRFIHGEPSEVVSFRTSRTVARELAEAAIAAGQTRSEYVADMVNAAWKLRKAARTRSA